MEISTALALLASAFLGTAVVIANAVAFQPWPRKRNAASTPKSSVVEGMLTRAPRAGSR